MRRTTGSRLPLLLCLLLVTGCGRAVNRTAERRIRELLPDLLGSARQYRVHVTGAATSTLRGRLAEVTVNGYDVQFPNGLLIDNVEIDLHGVDYDIDQRRLRHIESTHFVAHIGQSSLEELMAGEAPPGETLKNIRVSLSGDNSVTLSGKRILPFGLAVPFEIGGPLQVAGPQRIAIDAQRLKVVGIPVPAIVRDFLKARFESGIDLKALAFPIQLTGVSTTPGLLTLEGVADLTGLLQRRQERP